MPTAYDPSWVKDYCDNYGMKEWNRWESNAVSRISWAVHVYYLRKFVKQGERVLEVGAGAGRFTQVLAEITSSIVVADISRGRLEIGGRTV